MSVPFRISAFSACSVAWVAGRFMYAMGDVDSMAGGEHGG